ncbi:MAG: DUF3010 family protein [Gammaproteobacteria bacterium]|nr:DUF3010 family protein [Gammaproteobacteria bacterium]
MRVCGVDLTANDAVICLLFEESRQFTLANCRVRKLSLPKNHTLEDLRQFQFAFAKLMGDYKVNRVAIRERMTKGKFAGGAVSFKLEAAIQLIDNIDVVVLPPTLIKTMLKENPLAISFDDTDLKEFQKAAFTVAYASHMIK